MIVLGISAFYHDSAACLVKDGEIVAAAQEERFTRRRHDPSFPTQAVNYCLAAAGASLRDVEVVAFYEQPELKFERILATHGAFGEEAYDSFSQIVPRWLEGKIDVAQVIRSRLDYHGRIVRVLHHQSHAASAFFPSPYRRAAILTVDGVGEWSTTTWGTGIDNRIELKHEIRFPHSLGLLYSAFTAFTGFKVNSGEYKLMGLAPFGEPRYVQAIMENLIDLKSDGSFRLNLEYLDFCLSDRMFNSKFEELFGGAQRTADQRIDQRIMDVARSIQEVTNQVMLRLARHIRRESGLGNLCLAGGVALNCVANGHILKEKIFDNLWIQPAAGDAGGALGAALHVWFQELGNRRQPDDIHDSQKGSLLGPSFNQSDIEQYLRSEEIPFNTFESDELSQKVAELIADGKVIGWFQDRMEFGPRALGARSILGDARSSKMQEVMNLKIKFRESFRPFAPAVLKEAAHKYFELDCESPYMLLVAEVRGSAAGPEHSPGNDDDLIAKLKRVQQISALPAITHVDYSARVQTVDEDRNPAFYNLLKALERLTGCPMVVNTSFNVRGEPIVCTPQEAYRCFVHTGMDYLVLGGCLVNKAHITIPESSEDYLGAIPAD